MARPLRLEFPGAIYHLTARGDRREAIYENYADRCVFLRLFGDVCERLKWRCYAYCLMGNHYHLVVETPDANLSKGMRQLNGIYTQAFNRRHGRVGHVFQGRYGAILVDKDAHLLELSRYVVLNPVRAALVQVPEKWPWSSYRAMLGDAVCPEWLHMDWLLEHFGATRAEARLRYAHFVKGESAHSPPWKHLNSQIFLGDDAFVARCQRVIKSGKDLSEVPRAQRRPNALPLATYAARHRDRRDAMAEAYSTGQYTLQEIAKFFGVHYTTVSRAVQRSLD